jgi:hypothetical protein
MTAADDTTRIIHKHQKPLRMWMTPKGITHARTRPRGGVEIWAWPEEHWMDDLFVGADHPRGRGPSFGMEEPLILIPRTKKNPATPLGIELLLFSPDAFSMVHFLRPKRAGRRTDRVKVTRYYSNDWPFPRAAIQGDAYVGSQQWMHKDRARDLKDALIAEGWVRG